MEHNLLLGMILVLCLFSGCVELEKEQGTSTTLSTVTTTSQTTTSTSTTSTTTTSSTTTSTTTTTISKLTYTCADYCRDENYAGGKCRRSPSKCRIYGINETYEPQGNKYCPQGRGYGACCCIL